MEMAPIQRKKNSHSSTPKYSHEHKIFTNSLSFNWRKASASTGKWYTTHRLRRFLNRHLRTFRMGMETLSSRMQDMKVPKAEKWKKSKNTMTISHHFTRYQREFRRQMTTFIVGAFSFVAALVWNDAIKETLKMIEFNSNFIFYKYITAVIVSVVCVLIIIFLSETTKFKVSSS